MNKISIVVPVYNMEDKVETCVQALTNQTYQNIEIILVDDGSKDNSFICCQNLALRDNRIRVFHTENHGSGPARNYGIEQAAGDYIYFPDADDYLDPKALEILEKVMREGNSDLVVFGFKNIFTDGTVKYIKKYSKSLKNGCEIRSNYSEYMTTVSKFGIQGAPWNKLFDLNLIKQHDLRYPALRRHQDEGFIARYMSFAQHVHFIPDILYTYYTNDLSKEWDKYPIDYIEAVKGLYEERKTNILLWNPEDEAVHDLVYKEYICGVIKSLELSFSPKFDFDKKNRGEWINKIIEESGITDVPIPKCLGKYQSQVLKLIKKRHSKVLYNLLELKINVEKRGILNRR